MIYQYVKRYLKHTFHKPKVDAKWSSMDNIKFFTFVEKRYSTKEFEEEVDEVKEAFKDFFEPVGNIVFRYKDTTGVKFKVFPYRVAPKDSKHLKRIIQIIHQNRKAIKHPYQDQENQIGVLGKVRRAINTEIVYSNESINKKELIKYAIRKALELNDRDIIVQLKRVYIIKLIEEKKTAKPTQSSKAGTNAKPDKFNGYTAQQIEESYKEIFEKNDANITFFLKDVMKTIFKTGLDFRTINNKFYEDNALKIIHFAIAKELKNYVTLEHDYILGITGFLMRKHFYALHELMARELIESIHEKNLNANEFLLFYTGKVIIREDKKYQIPCLETEDGKRWNNSSLIGICNLWMNIKMKKENYENKLLEADLKIGDLTQTLLYIEPEKKEQEEIIAKTVEEMEPINKHHLELEAKLRYLENTALNSDEFFKLEEEFKESQVVVDELQSTIDDANANIKAIKDTNITTYTELDYFTDQKKKYLLDIKALDSSITSKSSQIDPILKSIVKVLMARKKLIK